MSLHIRVETSFWNHRKTLRLRAAIGESAFWIPPRLWSYAAGNQPNGDFSDYSAEELAMLIGYQGDAQAMLEALQRACFFDGMKIHDWAEHNGYHATFSERARTAARARWKGKEKTREDKKGKEASIATSINASSLDACKAKFSPVLRETFDRWISFRKGLGKKPKDWDALFVEQAKWLTDFSEKDRIEILSQSMRNCWQGLFPVKSGANGAHSFQNEKERRQAEIDEENRIYREKKLRKEIEEERRRKERQTT